MSTDGYAWFRGALGEIAVGRLLSRLDSKWVVLHAVPVGRGADIDHVVVGPSGVFTVNTKNHSGKRVWVAGHTFLVSGSRTDHIRNSEFEGRRAAKLLGKALGWPVPIRPVIAVYDPQRLHIEKPPAGVDVVDARRLVRWLKKRPAVLGPEAVEHIVSVIGELATWRYQPDESVDVDRRAQFDAIQAEIGTARRVRMAWAFGMVAVMTITIVLVWPALLQLLTIAVAKLLDGSA
ncbi:nuclease-related domain-containing protein [Kribbella pittospori]|uniref:nuclease-related domain-containing protein n=1 Tax=Kribbella pittospori TaxID=722689 RepID=UPI00192D6709|nr:nuclease-related domain-containing protein [Kribbella pittospori]